MWVVAVVALIVVVGRGRYLMTALPGGLGLCNSEDTECFSCEARVRELLGLGLIGLFCGMEVRTWAGTTHEDGTVGLLCIDSDRVVWLV